MSSNLTQIWTNAKEILSKIPIVVDKRWCRSVPSGSVDCWSKHQLRPSGPSGPFGATVTAGALLGVESRVLHLTVFESRGLGATQWCNPTSLPPGERWSWRSDRWCLLPEKAPTGGALSLVLGQTTVMTVMQSHLKVATFNLYRSKFVYFCFLQTVFLFSWSHLCFFSFWWAFNLLVTVLVIVECHLRRVQCLKSKNIESFLNGRN